MDPAYKRQRNRKVKQKPSCKRRYFCSHGAAIPMQGYAHHPFVKCTKCGREEPNR